MRSFFCTYFLWPFMGVLLVLWAKFAVAEDSILPLSRIYKRYDETPSSLRASELLGLSLYDLLEANKTGEAKKKLEQALKKKILPKHIAHWALAKVALRDGRYRDFKEHLKLTHDLGLLKNTDVVKDLLSSLKPTHHPWLIEQLIRSKFFELRPPSACPYFELNQRKARADIIFSFLRQQELPTQVERSVFRELYIHLPEAVSVSELSKLKDFSHHTSKISASDFYKRMELLLTFGQVDEARKTFMDSQKNIDRWSKEELCELRYADAKVERWLRRYSQARKMFSSLASECMEPIRRKSRYMNLALAAKTSDVAALPQFDEFVHDYENHSFSDDVLLFKASILENTGGLDESQKVLAELIKKYPDGDMVGRALFLKAFNHARLGENSLSLASLDELKRISPSGSLDFAQACYWKSRLQIMPTLNSAAMAPGVDVSEPKKQLISLINSWPSTVYSWLALSLLDQIGIKIDRKIDMVRSDEAISKYSFPSDLEFETILFLIKNGFRDEAQALLDDMPVEEAVPTRSSNAALFYYVLNRAPQAHHKLIRCHGSLADRLSKKMPEIFWELSYPQPFEKEMDAALARVDAPMELVYGVMRQESGFFADALSWAGASGLMQLRYSSALEQAKKWDITDLVPDDLSVPDISLTLGASLLQSYWQRFGGLTYGLAAYNAGPSAVKTWKSRNDGPVDTFIESISYGETRNYVKSVLGATFAYMRKNESISQPELRFTDDP